MSNDMETRALNEFGPLTTGRTIVILKDGAISETEKVRGFLENSSGLRNFATSSDYSATGVPASDLEGATPIYFDRLGVLVVDSDEMIASLAADDSDPNNPILAIEPEYIAYPVAAPVPARSADYVAGYRDGVTDATSRLGTGAIADDAVAEPSVTFADTAQFTWGLQAVRAHTSRFSGLGIRVAILDTGIDLTHPDFRGRSIIHRVFAPGVTIADVSGHGTHVAGTACGSRVPANGVRRYGVAYGSQIFVGKVFNNGNPPGARTGDVIAGIDWAVVNGCRVVNLSLGANIDQRILQYEAPISRALRAGTLVVAAAGNNANRPGNPGFVTPPANADAAMAAAAIDRTLAIARFSARSSSVTGAGGRVNLAAPGVSVFSSVPGGRHASFNGTSMACPHVAGVAALWAQKEGLRGAALWNRLVQTAAPLNLAAADVGSGMVQAPQ